MPVEPATSVQLVAGVNDPVPLEENVTLPVGVVWVPGLVSVTVALHDVFAPVPTFVGEQLTAVPVVRVVTVSGVSPLLSACVASPA